jgi:hypothetical protein
MLSSDEPHHLFSLAFFLFAAAAAADEACEINSASAKGRVQRKLCMCALPCAATPFAFVLPTNTQEVQTGNFSFCVLPSEKNSMLTYNICTHLELAGSKSRFSAIITTPLGGDFKGLNWLRTAFTLKSRSISCLTAHITAVAHQLSKGCDFGKQKLHVMLRACVSLSPSLRSRIHVHHLKSDDVITPLHESTWLFLKIIQNNAHRFG